MGSLERARNSHSSCVRNRDGVAVELDSGRSRQCAHAMLNGDYYFHGRHIYGPDTNGEYYLHDDKWILGPDTNGEFYILSNHVYGPGQNGDLYILNGRFFGPCMRLPWMT